MAEHARTADEAAAAAIRTGMPAVLKVLSPDVTHKSEVGGVMLQLTFRAGSARGLRAYLRNLAERAPQARFDGVTVQAMAAPGVELIIGDHARRALRPLSRDRARRDFRRSAAGYGDAIAPVDADEARAMLAQLRGRAILHGVRGGRSRSISERSSN